jgi:hypothetical protein
LRNLASLYGAELCEELITRPEESYRLWCVIRKHQELERHDDRWAVEHQGKKIEKFWSYMKIAWGARGGGTQNYQHNFDVKKSGK